MRTNFNRSCAVLDTFTRDNTHQRAILSINNGETLSLNLRHGKRPRELLAFTSKSALADTANDARIVQQTNRLANFAPD